ncbi:MULTISPECIES: EAL domain-containing protein [Acidobacteriaceae]|uniref:sensor domain-containing phosphodiesterase n=1 Tax=Acidobacteriaceae TaxID=204434 RepID=UPI00131D182A|nr:MULTISPECIES: EAL domain-containing protein [Acidobacteriaceae]MDW5266374.1 EAL domain-containing protein [Edaphobacter sp.]
MVAAHPTDLRKALDADEIVPYFQPIVELRTGVLTGFEALARWRHPVQGPVSPDVFIPLAEENGLIGILTRNLLRRVFTVAATLPDKLSISFNISPLQFSDRSLSGQISSAAKLAGFSLERLILEITESALIGNIDQAQTIAQELKALGVSLALDDFGTGYSSLRHLQALPFDELKIDASFVREMSDTKESRKIVAAIIGLGHSLSLTTVAEGVETTEQAEMLLRLGCDIGQGWLYGPPVPPDDLASFLSSQSLSPSPPSPSTSAKLSEGDTLPSLEALPAQRLAQLQTIYEGAPVGLCFLDRSLRYVSINRQLAEMNGVPLADHLGRTVQDVIPGLFPEIESYLRRVLQGETFTDLEFTTQQKDAEGHNRTLLVAYLPVRDEANEVVGISAAIIDITSRKLMEKALRESEEHYRNFVELNPQIPWTSDAQGMIIEAGPRWEGSTGWTPEQALNQGWIKGLHPADVIPTLRVWAECRRSGRPVDIEFRIGRGDGIWRWMRSRAAPRRDSAGDIIRWYGTLEDIDDRKKAEHALRENEALLRAVFNAVPMGLIISESPSNRILMCNPRAEAILRSPIPTGANIDTYRKSNLFHTDGRPFGPEEYPMERAIRTDKTTESEDVLYRYDDGTHAWMRITAAPIRGKKGGIAGAVLAIQLINQATQERQKLLDRIAELEQKLKSRS